MREGYEPLNVETAERGYAFNGQPCARNDKIELANAIFTLCHARKSYLLVISNSARDRMGEGCAILLERIVANHNALAEISKSLRRRGSAVSSKNPSRKLFSD